LCTYAHSRLRQSIRWSCAYGRIAAMKHRAQAGFSLIELLIVIAIVGILAGIVYVNFGGSSSAGRDAQRVTDLRNLQSAIEQYKQKYGRYPERGCSVSGNTFATETSCPGSYISGLAPEFIPRLPSDPRRDTGVGYAYLTNADGTVYKLMADRTVESEIVTDSHSFKSCDILHNNGSDNLNVAGWCSAVHFSGNNAPTHCQSSNIRFQRSYAVWGGYAPPRVIGGTNEFQGDSTDVSRMRDTTNVICR